MNNSKLSKSNMKLKQEVIEYIQQQVETVSLGSHSATGITKESRIIGDLGLDSMDYATIMLATETFTGIKIKEDGVRWAEIQTIEQLADLFLQQGAG